MWQILIGMFYFQQDPQSLWNWMVKGSKLRAVCFFVAGESLQYESERQWLLGMDLHIGSEHGFKCWGANSLREFCVCVKEKKRQWGREKGRCYIDGTPRFSSLSWIIMILSWWDAASKRWEYAWTVDELEPAYEPKLVVAHPSSHPISPAGEFLNRIDADINERESWGGGFWALLYLLRCTHML